VPEEEY
jgi:hypothetical protein